MNAIIIGATGAVGRDLLDLLLASPDYERVDAFVRRDFPANSSKLHVHVIDFDKPESWRDQVHADGPTVLFSCLGTTLRQAGSKKNQWRVDYEYQFHFAYVASECGVMDYVLVSSMGANERSLNFYMRMKGQLEDAVRMLSFRHITIVQPPSLIRRNSDRWAETLSVRILLLLNKVGILRSVAPMPTQAVAACMMRHAWDETDDVTVITNQDILTK